MVIVSALVYDSCARICARIFMKFESQVHMIGIDCRIKFHEDSFVTEIFAKLHLLQEHSKLKPNNQTY